MAHREALSRGEIPLSSTARGEIASQVVLSAVDGEYTRPLAECRQWQPCIDGIVLHRSGHQLSIASRVCLALRLLSVQTARANARSRSVPSDAQALLNRRHVTGKAT
eukprot:6099877-Prymnesium_polylepis.2